MDNNIELKELAKELTSMYMKDYQKRKPEFIKIYAKNYISKYRTTYETLTKNYMFKKHIDVLAKEIALTYTEGCINRNPRSMDELIKTFINAYKYALAEVEKDETLKEITELPKQAPSKENKGHSSILPEYKPREDMNNGHTFESLPSPNGVKPTSILPEYKPEEDRIPGLIYTGKKIRRKQINQSKSKGLIHYNGF